MQWAEVDFNEAPQVLVAMLIPTPIKFECFIPSLMSIFLNFSMQASRASPALYSWIQLQVNGDMESIEKASFHVDLLLAWNLSKVEMVAYDLIQSFIGEEFLWKSWECML